MWQFVSKFLFLIRITRLSKGNLGEIRKCIKLANERYDSQYDNKLTFSNTYALIKKYGLMRAL